MNGICIQEATALPPVVSCTYESPLGTLLLGSDGTAITGVWFSDQKNAPKDFPLATTGLLPAFFTAKRWLDDYFTGKIPGDLPPLALFGTRFSLCVWQKLLQIPYGKTVTYGQIAEQIALERGIPRMSAQAVGRAVGNNPVSIFVPCHRVLGAGGALVGYAGGLYRKEALLLLEREGMQNRKRPSF